jgi:hypothetical protein
MRRALVGLAIVLSTAASAEAVTLREIVDLTRAGLGEEVILALIEVDGGVFDVDAGTLAGLKAAGVSEKVIVALVRSGRERHAPPEPQQVSAGAEQQAPTVVYVEQPPTTVVREVAVPFPVYVALPRTWRGRHVREHAPDELYPVITAPAPVPARQQYLTDTPPPARQQEPVYWGFGGKLRPDAWQPPPAAGKK